MQRLKTRPQFQAVLAGELVAKTRHFALHRVQLDTSVKAVSTALFSSRIDATESWLGAMTPKRWAKRAVTRNAIKRQIYAVTASLIPLSFPAVYLVRLRREFARTDFTSASSEMLKQAVRGELAALMQSVVPLGQPRLAVV